MIKIYKTNIHNKKNANEPIIDNNITANIFINISLLSRCILVPPPFCITRFIVNFCSSINFLYTKIKTLF